MESRNAYRGSFAMLALEPDVVVSAGPQTLRAFKQATVTVLIELVPIWEPDQTVTPLRRYAPPEPR